MNQKYAGKTIVLPKETSAKVGDMQIALAKRLGFRPSYSETVAVAITEWLDRNQGEDSD